jgi:hypothetical protein
MSEESTERKPLITREQWLKSAEQAEREIGENIDKWPLWKLNFFGGMYYKERGEEGKIVIRQRPYTEADREALRKKYRKLNREERNASLEKNIKRRKR